MTRELFQEKDDSGLESLDGVLERIVFFAEDSGWTVGRLLVEGSEDLVAIVGSLPAVEVGESLHLRGRWVNDAKWGRQFRVESFLAKKPATLVGMERYLGSGLVRGIGRAMAARLVTHFGLATLDVIEHASHRLNEVEGIGPVRSRAIRDAWLEQRDIKEVMVFLQGHGVSSTFATKIYKRYQKRAIQLVSENPYRLASDIHGIGFRSADRIASSLGIAANSPARAEAGVLHILEREEEAGHCYAPRHALVGRVLALLELDPEKDSALVESAVDRLSDRQELVLEPLEGEEGDQSVYRAALHALECEAAARLTSLASAEHERATVDLERALAWFEERQGIVLAPAQRRAVAAALEAKLLVLTGGPGTGKTTIVRAILRIFEAKRRRVLLAAPTGRAAKRLSQASEHEAKTLHRLLEFTPREMTFQRGTSRPLEADLVVVDEVSMVDLRLFVQLLRALPPRCQLILVGDVDQLPSVGAGSVLADVLRWPGATTVRLTEIFRQAKTSRIVLNAHRINRGELPELEGEGEADFFFIEQAEPEAVLATLKQVVGRRIAERFGLDPLADVQVLTPMQKGTLGAIQLNEELQALLNGEGASCGSSTRKFRVGDKVMQVVNNYDLEIFNGDIGIVLGGDQEAHTLRVSFDGRTVEIDEADLDELVLAYACSIHKSQGSEYPAVVIPLHTQHYVMLERNLLYTAVTRGKRLVVVIGSRRALEIAVRTERKRRRCTRLSERLCQRTPSSS